MYRYFKTKAQAKQIQRAEAKKWAEDNKKRVMKEMKEEKERAWWRMIWDETEKRDREMLNCTYRMVRYWIEADGTVLKYGKNYLNPWIRYNRIIFLEDDIARHGTETQNHIDEVLSKRPESSTE